jgi:hypothetical protein
LTQWDIYQQVDTPNMILNMLSISIQYIHIQLLNVAYACHEIKNGFHNVKYLKFGIIGYTLLRPDVELVKPDGEY